MGNVLKKNDYFLISVGAVPASILRWQIDEIFIVNIIGCFLIGFINALSIPKRYKLIFGLGFCGTLTTFSGWSLILSQLIIQGLYKSFFLNSILLVLMSFVAVILGDFLAKKIIN